MMRSVCFVDRLELEFSGNHFCDAVILGDVDNDGVNELLIGNVDGVFAIFKGDVFSKPWKKCSELGTVTCVYVGDVCNTGSNSAIVINAEARCYIFNIESAERSLPQSPLTTPTAPPNFSRTMKLQHKQTLPVRNAKTMCLAQLGSRAHWTLCVGHTDRCVSAYRWNKDTSQLDLLKKFSLSGQVGSLSVGLSASGQPQVLVSQPGGTYRPISCPRGAGGREERGGSEGKDDSDDIYLGDVIGQAQRRNPTSSTNVVGQIRQSEGRGSSEGRGTDEGCGQDSDRANIVALCTLDGVVRLLQDERKQWELQVDHSLFSIGKLDVTGSGSDEIVVCAWDGTTYVVDQKRNCVRFRFDQNVSAFTCGYYGTSEGRHVPCLVYTTFTNMVYLYREVSLPTVPSSNLLLTLENDTSLPAELKEKLKSLSCKEKQELLGQCLYCSQEEGRRREREGVSEADSTGDIIITQTQTASES